VTLGRSASVLAAFTGAVQRCLTVPEIAPLLRSDEQSGKWLWSAERNSFEKTR
jgi:hypothetical protein